MTIPSVARGFCAGFGLPKFGFFKPERCKIQFEKLVFQISFSQTFLHDAHGKIR